MKSTSDNLLKIVRIFHSKSRQINTLNTEPKFQIPFCIRKFDQVFDKNYLFDIFKNITNHLYIVSGVKINQKNHDIYICHPYMGTSVFRNSKIYYKIINFFVDQFWFSQNVIKSCLYLTRGIFSYDIYICHPYTGNRKFQFFKNSFLVIITLHEVCYYINQPIQPYKKFRQNFCSRGTDDIYICHAYQDNMSIIPIILSNGLVDIVTYLMPCYDHKK